MSFLSKLFPENRGDKFEAFITETDRQVIKAEKGGQKFSAVRYPSGRIVETRSYMLKNRNASNLLDQSDE